MQSDNATTHCDVLLLGSGEAAKYLAWHLGSEGKRCVVIEKMWIGGSCPNVACLPSKNVTHSAKVAHHVSRASQLGFSTGIEKAVPDLDTVIERKKTMVVEDVGAHRDLYSQGGVEVIEGTGKFVDRKTIAVVNEQGYERTVSGDTIVVCTGSRSTIANIPGLRAAFPMTHVELLDLREIPDHLIVLGAGYTGLEFAQAMKRLGAAVTIVSRSATFLPREDEDVSTELQSLMRREGINVYASTVPVSVSGTSGVRVRLTATQDEQQITIDGSHIFCGTGRTPNTDQIGAENAGLILDAKGHIIVDEFCSTSSSNDVFAAGACAGSPYSTHAGHDDYRIVRDFLSGRRTSGTPRSSRTISLVLFTDPEFAQVGLRESEARAQGIPYRLVKASMNTFNRAITLRETDGFVKALIGAENDLILGFAAIGAGAGELLPVIQLAMEDRVACRRIADLVIAHPTMNEGLGGLFGAFGPISPSVKLVDGEREEEASRL